MCDGLASWTNEGMHAAWGAKNPKLKGWQVARVELLQAYFILESVRLKHDLGSLFKEFDVTDAGLPPDCRYALSAFVDMAKALKLKGGGGWPERVLSLIAKKSDAL
eukprot:5959752-Prymnesium_polylepis.1